jgi:hypothetical protein
MTEAFAQISSSPRGERSDETVFGKPLAEVMMEQRLRLLKGGYSPAVPFVVSACIAFLRAKGTRGSSLRIVSSLPPSSVWSRPLTTALQEASRWRASSVCQASTSLSPS